MFVVDKIDNNIVVLENMDDKSLITVDVTNIYHDVKIGDLVEYINGKYTFNKEETIKRAEYIKNLTKNLW